MKPYYLLAALGLALVFAPACKKSETTEPNNTNTADSLTPPAGMVQLASGYLPGARAKVYLYAKHALNTGYQTIYAAVADSASGKQITDGHLTMHAEMDMVTMKHSCPSEINEELNATTKLWSSNFVFTMPTSMMGKWSLNIQFHNHTNDLSGNADFAITIADASPKRLFIGTMAADDSSKVFVSFALPETGKIGMNDAMFTIHRKGLNDSFPAITDYTVEMIPTMPDMGHGSPGNINPVHTGNGHYEGKLNFTMTGLWRIQLKLYKNGTMLTDQIFYDLTF